VSQPDHSQGIPGPSPGGIGMYAEMMRLEMPSDIQIVDAICLFALLSLHTLQCFLSLTNSQTHLFDFALVLHTLA
jgi:hypothetical protein